MSIAKSLLQFQAPFAYPLHHKLCEYLAPNPINNYNNIHPPRLMLVRPDPIRPAVKERARCAVHSQPDKLALCLGRVSVFGAAAGTRGRPRVLEDGAVDEELVFFVGLLGRGGEGAKNGVLWSFIKLSDDGWYGDMLGANEEGFFTTIRLFHSPAREASYSASPSAELHA